MKKTDRDEAKEEKTREIQQKYVELQMLDQQMKQVQNQIQALEIQTAELDLVQKSLDEFSSVKPGSDSFVTVTPGIFAKAEIKDSEKVFLNIGAGAVVEKTIPEAKKIIVDQITEMRKLQEDLTTQLDNLASKAAKVEAELKKLVE